MKTYFRFRDLFYVLICSGILATSCSDDSLPMTDNKEIADSTESPDAWHDKIREKPYPKADNEIFINPAPFIVPQDMMTTPNNEQRYLVLAFPFHRLRHATVLERYLLIRDKG